MAETWWDTETKWAIKDSELTVKQLRELLAQYDDETPVFFSAVWCEGDGGDDGRDIEKPFGLSGDVRIHDGAVMLSNS